jgi:hypothetical protein
MSKVPVSTIVPFGLRLQPELKSRLEESAIANNRSLNAEIAERLRESLEAPSGDADHQLEMNAILTGLGNTIAEVARKDNERDEGMRALGQDLHALCDRALPVITDEERYRSLIRMLGDVGVSLQAGDITDAQGRLRALYYLAIREALLSDVPKSDELTGEPMSRKKPSKPDV